MAGLREKFSRCIQGNRREITTWKRDVQVERKMNKMQKYLTKLNIIFTIQLTVVALVAVGFLPREAAIFLAGLLAFYFIFSPLEESVFSVARSIPLFIALPLTENFDSFNTWRPLALILFLKICWQFRSGIFGAGRDIFARAESSLFSAAKFAYQNYKIEFLSFLLFAAAVLSLLKAQDFVFGARRLVYFANLGMLFFAVRAVVKKENFVEFSKNVLISGAIISAVGVLQLISSYLMTIDYFAEFWALTIQQNLYGKAWAYIVISANTWFAYYQDTIHLRMFSSFPDTHSFPLYLLMVSAFALTLILRGRLILNKNSFWLLALLNLFTVCLILSGTRGIWAGVVFPAIFAGWVLLGNFGAGKYAKFLLLPVFLFFLLLPFAALVYTSPQFKSPASESEKNIFAERFKSIIDTGETSNSGRIFIWKETLKSIAREPLLGVGIGNFPVVLKEDVALLKAGASAHNLYLNIAAETGLFGFAIFILLLFETTKAAWRLWKGDDLFLKFFGFSFLFYFIWILGYSLTDAAIFDERPFLMMMLLVGSLFGLSSNRYFKFFA